jgi:hypothetical protein
MTDDRRKDHLWILIVSMMIMLWSSIPTWAGYQMETAELRFRGIYFDFGLPPSLTRQPISDCSIPF